jgi:predicted dehydrogenase
MTVRWGILGTARINRRVIPAMRLARRSDLISVASRDRARADAYAREWSIPRAVAGYQTLLDDSNIDAVYIPLPNTGHVEWTLAAIAAGKHVLCEKPLASTVEDAEAMVKAADASGLVAACGFSYRRSPAVSAIGGQIKSGALGEIQHFNGRYWCDYSADPDAPTSWRYEGPLGSGALADLGSHLVDMSEQLCGPIIKIDGAALPILINDRPVPLGAALGHAAGGVVSDERRPVTNEDIATFVAEFANGAAGTFSISRVALGHPNSLGFEVFGTKAAARFDLSANAEFGYVDNAPDRVTNGWRRVIVGPDHPYVAAAQSMPFSGIGHGGQEFFTYQARAFLDEIAGLDRLPRQATFADGLRNMRVEEAIVKSAAAGAAETVPR